MTEPNLKDQLIQAIVDSKLTHYRIGKTAGITPPIIDRLVSGERDVTLETAAKIAQALGLKLVKEKKKKS